MGARKFVKLLHSLTQDAPDKLTPSGRNLGGAVRGGAHGQRDLDVNGGAFGPEGPPPNRLGVHVAHALPAKLDHLIADSDESAGVRATAGHHGFHPGDRCLRHPGIKETGRQRSRHSESAKWTLGRYAAC